jgi:protoporphyrinogen oxidase
LRQCEDRDVNKDRHITILGGGPAGLAAAYYAKKTGLPLTVYEERGRLGGNAVTIKHGDFLFDSGAHRFHDKDKEITREIRNLIGEDFRRIEVPSKIYYGGNLIDFPLSPLDLLNKLGLLTVTRAAVELLAARTKRNKKDMNFREFAVHTYGKTMAESFLLNYSEKLWGKPCNELSSCISGKRMKGLDLKTFLKEALRGSKVKTEHLDGAFYYPRMGIGTIVEKLAKFVGKENIYRNAAATRIFHDHGRILGIEINGDTQKQVDWIISTLPLPHLLKLLVPSPPIEILSLADELRFRNLIVVAIFIGKNSITGNGSIYFPESQFPFTRVYEPKNRSGQMSPPGKTSLCAEIPCFESSELWNMDEKKLVQNISSHFLKLGWIRKKDILDHKVIRLRWAYPILEMGFEKKSHKVADYLKRFHNLKLSGRNGRFLYTHIHDMVRFARDIIEELISD